MRQNPDRSRTKARSLAVAVLTLACSAVTTRADVPAAPTAETLTPASPATETAAPAPTATEPATPAPKPRREQPRRRKILEFGIGEDDPAQRRRRPA
jgi:hypothetical protein